MVSTRSEITGDTMPTKEAIRALVPHHGTLIDAATSFDEISEDTTYTAVEFVVWLEREAAGPWRDPFAGGHAVLRANDEPLLRSTVLR